MIKFVKVKGNHPTYRILCGFRDETEEVGIVEQVDEWENMGAGKRVRWTLLVGENAAGRHKVRPRYFDSLADVKEHYCLVARAALLKMADRKD